MNTKEFGEYFAIIRKQEGYKSQRDLADSSGISNATISRIESGSNRVTPEVLRELANCFVLVTYEELMEKAGYLNLEEVLNEYKDVYDLKKKLGSRYNDIIHEARHCKFYVKDKSFLEVLKEKKISPDIISNNLSIDMITFLEIVAGEKDILLSDAIKLCKFYKFKFSDIFYVDVSELSVEDGFYQEDILVKIESLLDEDFKEVEQRRAAERERNIRKNSVSVDEAKFNKEYLLNLIQVMSDGEIKFLLSQHKLYEELNIQISNTKLN